MQVESCSVLLSAVKDLALDTKLIENHYVKTKTTRKAKISLKKSAFLFWF